MRDIELLREVADLTAAGIGLEGVRRILELENHVRRCRPGSRELEDQLAAAEYALAVTMAGPRHRAREPARRTLGAGAAVDGRVAPTRAEDAHPRPA